MINVTDRGTEWRKWDLHVHTALSLRQDYGADTDETWDRYISELERLPPEFSVIGINDYWFVDGYAKLRDARANGRLSNLDAIFPVLELRLDQFGGTDSRLKRANLHVIFDPEIEPDVIREQFISAMSSRFQLTPEGEAAGSWGGVVSRQALIDLGRAIKASVPPEQVETFGADLLAGFNNLVTSLDRVEQALDTQYFRNRAVLALGKTEWADIKWQQGSVASKKNLVNRVRFLFTAFDDAADWQAQRAALGQARVNANLLDCSDAHTWSDSRLKDRIGNCATWLRAAPTFGGLLHALSEFESRVFVGVEPEDVVRLRTTPERVIDVVSVAPRGASGGALFDYSLMLNPGIVAVIGNKGQGKSALLDCIARAGNSSRGQDFAFLNQKRFLHPRTGQGDRYSALVRWRDGRERSVALDAPYEAAAPESVEYLPQELLERICNSDPTSEHRDAFEAELKRVIFHHIPRSQREGQIDLDSLLRLRTKTNAVTIGSLRDELLNLISRLLDLEARARILVPAEVGARLQIQYSARDAVSAELDAARLLLAEMSATVTSEAPELLADRERLTELERQVADARARDASDQEAAAQARRQSSQLDALLAEVELLRVRVSGIDQELRAITGVDELYVSLLVEDTRLASRASDLRERASLREAAIVGRSTEMSAVRRQMAEITGRLEVADTAREAQRRNVEQLETRLRQIVGQPDDSETIQGLERLLREAEAIPSEVVRARSEILGVARRIHEALLIDVGVIRTLYQPAATFVSEEPLAAEAAVQFEADLVIAAAWTTFTNALDGRRTSDLGTFLGARREALDTESTDDVADFIAQTLDRLATDRGAAAGARRPISHAFRSAVSVAQTMADFVGLKWLEARFGLTGSGMPLSQLSPGQRGLILLLFYLLVDRSDAPLLIDQPEENLDNDTARRLLVPALKKARSRRQIVIVTHNANLAVVGDADQIVSCTVEDDVFVLTAGSLEAHETGEITINVLEGSRAAFANRRDKYDTVVGPSSG